MGKESEEIVSRVVVKIERSIKQRSKIRKTYQIKSRTKQKNWRFELWFFGQDSLPRAQWKANK